MKIDSIRVGFISTNCYLLCDEETGVCALIDPGDKPEQVADMVSRSGCRLEYILLTHGHFDHTTAVRPLLSPASSAFFQLLLPSYSATITSQPESRRLSACACP